MKDNRKRFFYNGLMLTATALAVRSVSMMFNSYVTRSVGAEGVGLFTLIMTVYSFAITFATSGISLTITRLVAADVGEREGRGVGSIMRHGTAYALFFSVSASVVLFLFAPYLGARILSDARTVLPLRILALSLIPIAMCSLFSGYFVGVRRVINNAALQVTAQVVKIAVTVFLVVRLIPFGTAYAVIALTLSTTVTELLVFLVSFIQYRVDKRRHKTVGEAHFSKFSAVSGMAFPLALSAYIRSALLTLEHVLIPQRLRYAGQTLSESLAAYGILHGMALPLLIYPMTPLSSFSGLLVPEFASAFAKGEGERLRRITDEALNTTLVYAIATAAFMYTFAEELGYAVYDSYGAGHYIAILAPVIPIMYLDHVTDAMLKGIGEHVYSMWVNIADSVLSVLLVWFLIPVMGIAGYAVVIIVMELFNFSLSAVRLRKRIRFRIHPLRSLALPLLSALAASKLSDTLFVSTTVGAEVGWLVLKLIFTASAFFVIYRLLTRFLGRKARLCLSK